MNIKRIDEDFSICKVADYTGVNLEADYCFWGKTDEEHSLVCATRDVPKQTLARDDGWCAFRLEGVLDFSLIGIYAVGRGRYWYFCCVYVQHGLYFGQEGKYRSGLASIGKSRIYDTAVKQRGCHTY